MEKVKLHLGAGPIHLKGWVNIDIEPTHKPDICMDYLDLDEVYPENHVDLIYSCHSIEHLPYPHGVVEFFNQCNRVLKPGGTLRLVVPSLMMVASKYAAGEDLKDVYGSNFKGYYYKDCPAERMTYFMREWSHTIVFDEGLLRSLLLDAGFKNIRFPAFGFSEIKELRNLDRFATESLSAECDK
jgi:predicted SAM-dependent methyltransferase